MTDPLLPWVLALIAVLASVLTLISAATLGRYIAVIEYQRAAGINGIRRIQAIVNARSLANRTYLGVVFLASSFLLFIDLDPTLELWVTRVLFVTLLAVFAVSSVLDWLDDQRIVRLQLDEMRAAAPGAGSVP